MHLKLETTATLNNIPLNGRVHIIGVCGVAMGALALALADKGYEVSGSDKEFYPPMSDLLERSAVTLHRSYAEHHIREDVDLIVIGNSVPKTNEEVQAVEKHKLPHTFFAKLAGELLLADRKSIVVSGTHGKTTTTSLLAFGFTELGRDPSYFVGGEIPQLSTSFHLGSGDVGIIEGDEYDSVFYVKRPKFLFYPAKILILNALEFDHADIYSGVEEIEKEFAELLSRLPEDGKVIACTDYPRVEGLLSALSASQVVTFGRKKSADYQVSSFSYEQDLQHVQVRGPEGEFQLQTRLIGEINALNVLASTLAARECGVSVEEWNGVIQQFTGVTRRLQTAYEDERILLFEDFAHHPTAVREVIHALQSRYPDADHWVAFEPRSNTSRRSIFQKQYGESFAGAHKVFIRDIATRYSDSGQELMDLELLSSDIEERGAECCILTDGKAVTDRIIHELRERDDEKKLVITIMSNGSFDGLPKFLAESLGRLQGS